jgi:membrane-bound lytic murein transglycosylase F
LRRPLGALGVLALALAGSAGAQRSADRYDDTFRKYSKRFFGVGHDWRIFKAQGLTESRLDSAATSRVGARGLMQLMPSTFREIQSKNPEWRRLDDPEWNIAAGIYYDRQLWRLWGGHVTPEDHERFMFGSYNAGRVPLLTAQRLAREDSMDHRHWVSIEAVAPRVPRWRHRETVEYVARIQENLVRLDSRGRLVR